MMNNKVFISYSSKDKHLVQRLADDLTNNNISVWYDEWELKVGDSLSNKIQTGIEESSWLIIVISENSTNSKWVNLELKSALTIELDKNGVFILPVLIDDSPIPLFLKDKYYADFRINYEKGLEKLLEVFSPRTKFQSNSEGLERTFPDTKQIVTRFRDFVLSKYQGRIPQFKSNAEDYDISPFGRLQYFGDVYTNGFEFWFGFTPPSDDVDYYLISRIYRSVADKAIFRYYGGFWHLDM